MYLRNRSKALRADFKKLKMEGATELFVVKCSRLIFGTVRNTCLEFSQLFADAK